MRDPPPHDLRGDSAAPAGASAAKPAAGGAAFDFEAVIGTHESMLLRYVLNLLRCQPEQAEDVVQEAFLRLHRHVSTNGHENILDMSSWLFRVAHNLAMDSARKQTRHRNAQLKLAQNTTTDESHDDPLDRLAQEEARDAAMAELHELPQNLKQVLLLKVIGGMTLRQIGSITGLSVGNAAYRTNRALAELARRLKRKKVL